MPCCFLFPLCSLMMSQKYLQNKEWVLGPEATNCFLLLVKSVLIKFTFINFDSFETNPFYVRTLNFAIFGNDTMYLIIQLIRSLLVPFLFYL
ncbi:hypothetical protein NC651_001228 [Populus alba x Populus x berolinensis]|nr:hypothetical protein NC651_001228 [Populus alba x Populus x berolinensis]